MFKKVALRICFPLIALLITETASAHLVQLGDNSHRFHFSQDNLKRTINLNPAIGKVRYIAAIRAFTAEPEQNELRFYIETDKDKYIYASYELADYQQRPEEPEVIPAVGLNATNLWKKTASNTELSPKKLKSTKTIWTTIEVANYTRGGEDCHDQVVITVLNPPSRKESNWRAFNAVYSGLYTVFEDLQIE